MLAGGDAPLPGALKPTFKNQGAPAARSTTSIGNWRSAPTRRDFPCIRPLKRVSNAAGRDRIQCAHLSAQDSARAEARQGIYVEDTEGRTFIDCLAGAGALALGHSHPVVIEAIQSALAEEPPLQTLDLPTPLKDRFTRELFDSLPPAFQKNYKIQFCGPLGRRRDRGRAQTGEDSDRPEGARFVSRRITMA